ncbi:MAG: class I SAM-dependent methyltransferase [Deltaproteobacteria bacterium]|nr:class I SAM-dependent methyltransferase [Deltaproteobacteria bacterium]
MSDPAATVAETLALMDAMPRISAWTVDRLRPWCGRRVLEVGAGIGSLSELLVDRELLVATDVDEQLLARLRQRFAGHANVIVEHLDLAALPLERLRRHRVDTVLCVNVLEHVQDDRGALGALAALLPPGGHLLLAVPALPWLYGSLDRALGHHRRYARGALVRLLEDTGFRAVHLAFANVLGIPGWFLNSRVLRKTLLPRGQVRLYDQLSWLLRLEDRVRLPVGMSLFAVATRRA